MADIDDRKAKKVFRIRLGRYNIIIIRYKFGMHAGLLAHADNMLQLVVFCQPQGNGNLVQLVLRQDDGQVLHPSQHLDPPVLRTSRLIVRQNTPDDISPFRIGQDSVDILFGGTAVANQKDMLLVVPFLSHIPQTFADNIAHRHLRKDIYAEKHEKHRSGKIRLLRQIQNQDICHQADGIGLDDMPGFITPALYPLRRI